MCDPIFWVLGFLPHLVWAEPVRTTVGFPVRVEVVVPGVELEVVPVTERTCPVVVRIVRVSEATAGRSYDLEAQGLETGSYDLRDFLRRRDGSSTEGVPAIPIEVGSVLPANRFEPAELTAGSIPPIGGYRLLVTAAGAVWLLGVGVIWVTRPRKPGTAVRGEGAGATIAEELSALIAGVEAGSANPGHLADIERAAIAYWTRRLQLEGSRPAAALRTIREHSEAGPMLALLEQHLHHPGSRPGLPPGGWLAALRGLPSEGAAVPSGSREGRPR